MSSDGGKKEKMTVVRKHEKPREEKTTSLSRQEGPRGAIGGVQKVVVAEGGGPGVVVERNVDHLQPSGEGQGEKKYALA